MTTVAMNNLLNYIAGLNLSQRNRTWLADKIVNLPKKEKVSSSCTKMESSYERSMHDIKEGRIEKFASSEEMFHSLGI